MADPFSTIAGVAGLTDVAVKTSLRLRSLICDFKNAPVLILALSNEITAISIVLERVKESQKVVASLGDLQHDAAFLTDLDSQLKDAQTILTDLEALAAVLSAGNSTAGRFRWLRKKRDAANMKDKLKLVRERISELLVAHNLSLESRTRLELREVRISMEQSQARAHGTTQVTNRKFQGAHDELIAIRDSITHQQAVTNSDLKTVRDIMLVQGAEIASYKDQVNDQLSTLHNAIDSSTVALNNIQAEQTRQSEVMQIVQMAIISELAGLNTAVTKRQAGPTIRPVTLRDNSNSVIFFSFQLWGSCCTNGCLCRCHLSTRPDMSFRVPPMLRAVFGHLLLDYTGFPWSSARCNFCDNGGHMRFRATYCFPVWLCLRYMMYAAVDASTSGIFAFTLKARRRVPWKPGHILYESCLGSAETVRQILCHDKGCLVDVDSDDGCSALCLALNNGNTNSIEIMKILLGNGADPDQEDDYGVSFRMRISEAILSQCMPSDYLRALEGLIPLSCVEALDLSYIHKIVLGILPVSLTCVLQSPARQNLDEKDRNGCTPLMHAAKHGNIAAVRDLISAGAEVNEVNLHGETAMHRAITSGTEGDMACVDALLQAGSSCNASTLHGYSCLHLAAQRNYVAISRRLIDAGADIQAQTCYGQTPMWRAAHKNAVDMIRYLYSLGASLESTDSDGETPLFATIRGDRKEAAILLLRLGAKGDPSSGKRGTLLDHVASHASSKMMLSLAGVGVKFEDVTARGQIGLTAQQLLEKRRPDLEMRTAFARLVQAWCEPKGASDNTDDEEDCFYDAVDHLDGDRTE
ncbi:hypothetical protein NPX13_g9597 [Xylaria arbuscula]|uniref:Fungal N-terminal domain-containing protein n=1 Tax=Xylaria arbuscula TaxID=114810 RepID=A0A9W8N640_9PEZI|nr:hypothetical protein NPX13_g9597 [Xylaria arbuscula]